MTALGAAIVEVIRSALARTESLPPDEQDFVYSMVVSDLRSRRPMSVAPLSVMAEPTEPATDPRGRS